MSDEDAKLKKMVLDDTGLNMEFEGGAAALFAASFGKLNLGDH